ncbi:PLDc N-terminal domain-containing protein [Gramella sp. AN32]|uniref:PLDc N-terminal domain-containing protein n=1 Tax=Christiangramia antarctica TaxID=2058158 RepID=A0ABW5X3D7_9FLAO
MFDIILAIGPRQILLLMIVGGIFLLLPLIALIDLLRNEFTRNNKIIWLLVILLFPLLGAILYFVMAGKQKI